MGHDDIDWAALDRFVRGEGTVDERRALEGWVQADPARVAAVRAMRSAGAPAGEAPRWDVDAAWQRLGERREPRSHLTLGPPARHAPPRRRALASSFVATGITAAGLALLLARVPMRAPAPPEPPPPATRQVVTGLGERSSLTLSDGSRITVSAGSRLTIPGDLGKGGRRQVWLDGEAFFDIVHDSLRPFVVHTKHGVAEDLGTEFVVSTYPEVSGMRLAVREGLVALRNPGDTALAGNAEFPPLAMDTVALLRPGDVARVSSSGAVRVTRAQDVNGLFAAADGVLALQAVPLRDAIPRLERWYAITIDVPDRALLARRVSGTFREESAESAIGSVAMALEARAVWSGSRVTLVMDHQRGELQ